VFTPAGAAAPAISAADAQKAVASVISQILEERFAVDQQAAAYPRVVSNATLAGAYLWDLLADATSKKPWPQGSGASALVTAMANFLDDVKAILNPPAAPAGSATPAPKAGAPPAGSGTPKKKP
jgi:formiminotetrahydrofolate cyclodeaminase